MGREDFPTTQNIPAGLVPGLRVEERTTIRYPTLGFKSLLYPPKVFEGLEGRLFTGDGFSDRLRVSETILAVRFESSPNL
jgi:hypothetical protein